jgi:DNA-binding beta-propeller fold protein YncE
MLDIAPRPSGIAIADGLIWAEDHAATNRVYAIDPETGALVATIAVGRPCDIAWLDRRIWVADLDAGNLLWIDPKTRSVAGKVAGLHHPCGVQAISGAIWLAVDDGIARVDPVTGAARITSLTDGAAFPGSGQPLWAASFGSGDLVRIDPSSGKATLAVAHPGGGAEGPALAVGFDAVWVGAAQDRVFRLDPESGAVEAEISASQPARFLATGSGLWLTSYERGVVERIDPTSNAVVFRSRFNGSINGIADGLGGIWVSDTTNGRLYLLDPNATGVAP